METKYWIGIVGIIVVLFIAFGTYDTVDGLKERIKAKETEYAHYKDSTNQVNKILNKTIDSLALAKNKVDTYIKYVPVYVNELKQQSDSTIAEKVDFIFTHNESTTIPKDSSFKPIALVIKNSNDSLSGILIHKNVAIDYIASVELMLSYKLLSHLNQSEIDAWIQKYTIERTLREKSESLTIDYKDLIDNQDKQIRTYRSIAIGAGCGAGAAVLKGTPTEIGLSAAGGFVISYLYTWIF
jgi:hypothetical protein